MSKVSFSIKTISLFYHKRFVKVSRILLVLKNSFFELTFSIIENIIKATKLDIREWSVKAEIKIADTYGTDVLHIALFEK